MEDRILMSMRAQEWERAKGSLFALQQTLFGQPELFKEIEKATNDFIYKMEKEIGIWPNYKSYGRRFLGGLGQKTVWASATASAGMKHYKTPKAKFTKEFHSQT